MMMMWGDIFNHGAHGLSIRQLYWQACADRVDIDHWYKQINETENACKEGRIILTARLQSGLDWTPLDHLNTALADTLTRHRLAPGGWSQSGFRLWVRAVYWLTGERPWWWGWMWRCQCCFTPSQLTANCRHNVITVWNRCLGPRHFKLPVDNEYTEYMRLPSFWLSSVESFISNINAVARSPTSGLWRWIQVLMRVGKFSYAFWSFMSSTNNLQITILCQRAIKLTSCSVIMGKPKISHQKFIVSV